MTDQQNQAKKTITIELIKSVIGTKARHRNTLIGLRLRSKINSRSTLEDTPSVRGMIHRVNYLVKIVE